jgi:DNA-binding transcriptional LysR family regulator
MQLSLTDLLLFVAVAELGSLTGAAQRCHLSLPAVSQRMQAIEEQARCQLLVRGARGVRLTAAGEAFARHARTMLLEADSMRASLGAFAGGLQGHVTMLANTTAVTEIMPKVLATFLAAHPQVSVSLREQGNAEIARAVREGRADIGVVAGGLDLGGLDSTHFATDRLTLVVSRAHRLARRAKIAFAEVIDEPTIGLYESSTIQTFLAARVQEMGRPASRPRVEVNSFEAVCLMAEAGVGVGVVPGSVAKRNAAKLKIRLVPLTDAWALRRRYVVTRELASRPTYVGDLVEAVLATSTRGASGKRHLTA